jgi:hypothetical protein
MNIELIVRQYLLRHGYDGLKCKQCSCGLDKLMHCGLLNCECVPCDLKKKPERKIIRK